MRSKYAVENENRKGDFWLKPNLHPNDDVMYEEGQLTYYRTSSGRVTFFFSFERKTSDVCLASSRVVPSPLDTASVKMLFLQRRVIKSFQFAPPLSLENVTKGVAICHVLTPNRTSFVHKQSLSLSTGAHNKTSSQYPQVYYDTLIWMQLFIAVFEMNCIIIILSTGVAICTRQKSHLFYNKTEFLYDNSILVKF